MKNPVLSQKLKHVQLLLLDVDGVLTDGAIILNHDGGETKIFNVKDGLGLKLAMKAGIKVGIVTGRKSPALDHRCRDLGISAPRSGDLSRARVHALLRRPDARRSVHGH